MDHIDPAAVSRLRALIAAARAERSSLIAPDVVRLSAALGLPGRLVIDTTAVDQLGHPLVVLVVPDSRRASPPALAGLSPREGEVAALVAGGLANKQIGARLGISVGTVKHHVHRILVKSGLPSRAAIAAAVIGGSG